MNDASPETTPAPAWKPLDERQRRVLGVLIEKAKTTPAGYPMTVNAIVLGCNQKSNRSPQMNLDDFAVEKTLDELRTLGAVVEIDWLGRAAKYKHRAYEWLGVDKLEIAVMAELLLRGEQSLGELRGRAARMEPIPDLAALRPVVDGLLQRGLMVELTTPGRGQIVSHNLYLPPELADLTSRYGAVASRANAAGPDARSDEPSTDVATSRAMTSPSAPPAAPFAATVGGLDELRSQLAELREELARQRERIADLEARQEAR